MYTSVTGSMDCECPEKENLVLTHEVEKHLIVL
jgi:hypothetical protein